MRASLAASLDQHPGFEGYPKGSIVLCLDCYRPIYVLERGVGPGDRAGRAASAFRPLTQADCVALVGRDDLDAAWRGLMAAYMASEDGQRLLDAPRPVAGSTATCPCCGGLFLRIRTTELADTLDRAYVLEMMTIAPLAVGVNRWIGHRTRWAHLIDEDALPEVVDVVRPS